MRAKPVQPISLPESASRPAAALQALWDSPLALLVVDAGLRVQRANPALCALIGLAEAQQAGRALEEVSPSLHRALGQALARAAAGQPTASFAATAEGRRFAASAFPLPDAGGAIGGAGCALVELPERAPELPGLIEHLEE